MPEKPYPLFPCQGCGHADVHHAAPLMGIIDRTCKWRGCGCPWFINASPVDEPHRLSLSDYERDNLLHALVAANGSGGVRSPLWVLNTGDWLNQVLLKIGWIYSGPTEWGKPNVNHTNLTANANRPVAKAETDV